MTNVEEPDGENAARPADPVECWNLGMALLTASFDNTEQRAETLARTLVGEDPRAAAAGLLAIAKSLTSLLAIETEVSESSVLQVLARIATASTEE